MPSSSAIRRANVVLPAPGSPTARYNTGDVSTRGTFTVASALRKRLPRCTLIGCHVRTFRATKARFAVVLRPRGKGLAGLVEHEALAGDGCAVPQCRPWVPACGQGDVVTVAALDTDRTLLAGLSLELGRRGVLLEALEDRQRAGLLVLVRLVAGDERLLRLLGAFIEARPQVCGWVDGDISSRAGSGPNAAEVPPLGESRVAAYQEAPSAICARLGRKATTAHGTQLLGSTPR